MMNELLQKKNNGFTLVETLVAAGILAILIAVSAVGLARARAMLKITEMDNAARSIYMAAENQAVLLKNGKRLGSLVKKTGTGDNAIQATAAVAGVAEGEEAAAPVELYYIQGSDPAMERLLPAGSIDPALWDGDFYVFYEPVSGCVTDVFFCETAIGGMDQAFYNTWTTATREERTKPMLGYYGGGQAEGEETGPASAPYIDVEIDNGERLTVKVTYWLPQSVGSGDYILDVSLNYDTQKLDLQNAGHSGRLTQTGPTASGSGNTYTKTWVLDELGDRRFYELFREEAKVIAPGDSFTVTGTLTPAGDKFDTVTDSDTDNSLFSERSTGDTANIACLRHLQNLDQDYSKVAGKTKAVQESVILCHSSNETYQGYNFTPITNGELTSYDGKQLEIRELYVSGAGKDSGLFSYAGGTTFTGVRLVNATVNANDNIKAAGALAGVADNATIKDCRVYWEPDQGEADLRGLLGSDQAGAGGYRYMITGSDAGGLVGRMARASTIENSFAATTVKGTNVTGGLVGQNTGTLAIGGCYADCYLAGKAAGLVGDLTGDVTLTNSYAAGFIAQDTETAAGFCLGNGKTHTENCYSVMSYTKEDGTFYPLTQNYSANQDVYTTTFYRGEYKGFEQWGMSYSGMTDPGFAGEMGDAFGWKGAGSSHPYNLRESQNLVVYSFPGLKDLPHYGDWNAEFKEPSLVYYEKYSDGSYGFSGGNARYLIGELENDKTIVSDGYAVAIRADDLTESNLVITYTYFDENGAKKTFDKTYYKGQAPDGGESFQEASWDGGNYYLALLPNGAEDDENVPDLVNGKKTSENLYQYLDFQFTLGNDKVKSGTYFYIPHFAETVVPYILAEGESAPEWDDESAREYAAGLLENRGTVSIRTPRHLYSLSLYPHYYHNTQRRVTYHQRLDLNYVGYTGYELFPGPAAPGQAQEIFAQAPVGDREKPFNGSYNGDCHTITGVTFQADATRLYAGLFGFNEGTLRNIVYRMDPEKTVSIAMGDGSQSLYVGGLAGGNSGTVENCAVSGVSLVGRSIGSTIYVGGLAGQNNGIIRASGAETATLSAQCDTYARAYVGGLVGQNNSAGTIRTSYSVGRTTAVVDNTSDARICGFVGYNYGNIRDSYAAQDLRSSGRRVETFGFCGVTDGKQEGTVYLNKGNFTYRDVSYTANYVPRKAEEKKYQELADQTKASIITGMKFVEGDKTFPYPTAVTGSDGEPVHYGAWPVPMELGQMGVYYWEKLERLEKENTAGDGDAPAPASAYYVSLLAVEPEKTVITKLSTLSTARDDGMVVSDYGYGYYGMGVAEVTATTYQIEGWQGGTLTEVDAALAGLMPGFTFHSYRSFDPNTAPERVTTDLYPTGDPNGTVTLTQKGATDADELTASFQVNPHFADALAVKEYPAGWRANPFMTEIPGSKENPYEVRAVAQLELINWHKGNRDTRTVLEGTADAVDRFPYLCRSNANGAKGKYYWQQSHDLDGKGEEYTPIAEYYDPSGGNNGNLYGWFGGTYDGADYVIKNVSIKGGTASCAGLFGVVYGGTLKNMILHDESGQGRIESGHDENTQTRWYAIGALAGVAAKDGGQGGVESCAVSGYTITANVFTKGGADAWGGSCIGGLLGISRMDLNGCSAVTNIVVPSTAVDNDNMRIGGLVGVCQNIPEGEIDINTYAAITNCYAGGSIRVHKDASKASFAAGQKPAASGNFSKGIYIGGIVGGSYMKPLRVNGSGPYIGILGNADYRNTILQTGSDNTNNSIKNSYSYVTLPSVTGDDANPYIRAVYAIGGTGDVYTRDEIATVQVKSGQRHTVGNLGKCTISNCYYLGDTVLKNNPGGIRKIRQQNDCLSFKTDIYDTNGINYNTPAYDSTAPYNDTPNPNVTNQAYRQLAGDDIYTRLSGFAPVTSTEAGFPVPGKYSYAPSARKDLQGINYPFPTILTREGGYHVHYGQWPAYGIVRPEYGGAPIILDLFTALPHTEILTLEEVADGGWSLGSGEPADVAEATLSDNRNETATLTVTARKKGSTTLTIRNGNEEIVITVNVTTQLELQPTQVTVFENDRVTVPVTPHGATDALLPGPWQLIAAGASDGLRCSVAENSDTTKSVTIQSGPADRETQEAVNLHYKYTHGGTGYEGSSAVTVTVMPQPEVVEVSPNNLWTMDFSGYDGLILTKVEVSNGGAQVTITEGNKTLNIMKKPLFQGTEIPLEITLTDKDGLEHTLTNTITIQTPPPGPTP